MSKTPANASATRSSTSCGERAQLAGHPPRRGLVPLVQLGVRGPVTGPDGSDQLGVGAPARVVERARLRVEQGHAAPFGLREGQHGLSGHRMVSLPSRRRRGTALRSRRSQSTEFGQPALARAEPRLRRLLHRQDGRSTVSVSAPGSAAWPATSIRYGPGGTAQPPPARDGQPPQRHLDRHRHPLPRPPPRPGRSRPGTGRDRPGRAGSRTPGRRDRPAGRRCSPRSARTVSTSPSGRAAETSDERERRVRQPEPERVRRRGAVPVEQPLTVPPVVGHRGGVLVERRQVGLVARDGERQPAAGLAVAEQHVGERRAALHPGVPGQQDRRHVAAARPPSSPPRRPRRPRPCAGSRRRRRGSAASSCGCSRSESRSPPTDCGPASQTRASSASASGSSDGG